MAWEAIIFENYMPSEGMSAFFGVLYGTLVYITVPLFGMGILSVGLLAAFFAYSLRSHENRKIGIFMKTCCIFNACFIVLDILSLIIVLL